MAARDHRGGDEFGEAHGGEQVDFDDEAPDIFVGIEEGGFAFARTLADIVDEDVNRAEFGCGAVYECGDLGEVGAVGFDGEDAGAQSFEFGAGFGEGVGFAVDQGDGRTFRGEA
jgi:hypothetical protein